MDTTKYTLSKNVKNLCFALMGIGLVTFITGFFFDKSPHHTRMWANLLVNGFFFFAIALGATFFLALQYVAQAGWSIVYKRIFEAVSAYLPIGAIFLLLVFLVSSFHGAHLYAWMEKGVKDPASANYDKVIAGKGAFLNLPFFWIRNIIYFGVWIFCARMLRKRSLMQDTTPDLGLHYKNVKLSVFFIIFFAITSAFATWDWIMSIDAHWYSTLFAWYVFSGMWIGAIIVFIVMTVYLKNQGLMEQINDSHVHDLGKWLFALSFLWTYLWFAQFLLIWYANIPDEAAYYVLRVHHFKILFFTMMVINFSFPMLILMARKAKRNTRLLISIALLVFVFHWVDVYMLIMPGTVGANASIGIIEVGSFLGFAGIFIFVVLRALGEAPLIAKNDPYYEESLHLHT